MKDQLLAAINRYADAQSSLTEAQASHDELAQAYAAVIRLVDRIDRQQQPAATTHDSWQQLAAHLYQAAGAFNMPVRFLDILTTAANGEPFEHMLDDLLPVTKSEGGVWDRDAAPAQELIVPDGWELAPVEPTHEMLDAQFGQATPKDCYQSMLAAAPTPPADAQPDKKLPDLVVTKGGAPFADQTDGIRQLKAACLKAAGVKPHEALVNPAPATQSDGSTASYYELPESATELQHLISHRNMNAQIGEIFRACFRYGLVAHSPQIRDIKKIIFYAQTELERLEQERES